MLDTTGEDAGWSALSEERLAIYQRALDLVYLLMGDGTLALKPMEKLHLALLSKKALKGRDRPDRATCESYFRTAISHLFSDIRFVKDAATLTALTGRVYSKQEIIVLGKIDELNRKVEKVIADLDLHTLAEFMDITFDELASNQMLLARAKRRDQRAKLIIAADRVLRARTSYDKDTPHHKKGEPKVPELPTKKYNNIWTAEAVDKRLSELDDVEIISVGDIGDLDWMASLAQVVQESGGEEAVFPSPP